MNVKLYLSGSEVTLHKGSYTLSFLNKQSVKETEAGTLIRDIKRLGVPHLSVSMPVNRTEYVPFYNAYISNSAVSVKYYNPGTNTLETFSGFLENFSSDLEEDFTSGTNTEWNISFEITSH